MYYIAIEPIKVGDFYIQRGELLRKAKDAELNDIFIYSKVKRKQPSPEQALQKYKALIEKRAKNNEERGKTWSYDNLHPSIRRRIERKALRVKWRARHTLLPPDVQGKVRPLTIGHKIFAKLLERQKKLIAFNRQFRSNQHLYNVWVETKRRFYDAEGMKYAYNSLWSKEGSLLSKKKAKAMQNKFGANQVLILPNKLSPKQLDIWTWKTLQENAELPPSCEGDPTEEFNAAEFQLNIEKLKLSWLQGKK